MTANQEWLALASLTSPGLTGRVVTSRNSAEPLGRPGLRQSIAFDSQLDKPWLSARHKLSASIRSYREIR